MAEQMPFHARFRDYTIGDETWHGKADQVEGKTQNAVGGLKDKAREMIDGKPRP
jgi:hypothetical protein